MTLIPRAEYPEPMMRRAEWQALNGQWEFMLDDGNSGLDRHFEQTGQFDQTITVPYPPESELSGIHQLDFMPAVWYRRQFEVTQAQLKQVVRLHFGAVDYQAHVFVNGQLAGTHEGGYVAFAFDIQKLLVPGVNTVVVCAQDDPRVNLQPCGKQSREYASHDCDYTRTTGIWQSVWLEFMPLQHIEAVHFTPNVDRAGVVIDAT